MNFDPPPDNHPLRAKIRQWIAANPDPTGRELAEAGYVVPHWPEPYGLNADPIEQLIIDDELSQAGIRRPNNQIGIGWAAPTIFLAGTPEQHTRYLPKIFSGEELWCQLFSEPGSGSDLANLATRAVRDGDEYVINGSKIWSSSAHRSHFGILIARTDTQVPKHKGISYFILPMDGKGLTMTPIVDMTGAYSFNQVFFDNVRIPVENRVGEEGDGWRLAKVTLSNERVSLSSGGSLWGVGPTAAHLLKLMQHQIGVFNPKLRQRAVDVYIEAKLLELNRLRSLSATMRGETPGPEASIQKLMADDHGRHVMELAKDLAGAHGMIHGSGPVGKVPPTMQSVPVENQDRLSESEYPDVDPVWHHGFLFSPALTIGGGTFAIQRNILAEQVLGLPREPNVERGLNWDEARSLAV